MDFGPTLLTHAKADARTTRRNSSGNRQKGKKCLILGHFHQQQKNRSILLSKARFPGATSKAALHCRFGKKYSAISRYELRIFG